MSDHSDKVAAPGGTPPAPPSPEDVENARRVLALCELHGTGHAYFRVPVVRWLFDENASLLAQLEYALARLKKAEAHNA